MAVVALALLGAGLLPAAGCGNREPARSAPAPAPPPTAAAPAAERPVVGDDEVRKHWKAVEFLVREKRTGGGEQKVPVPVGGEKRVAGTPITVRVLHFVPDFAMGTDSVTTKSMKDANPAVKVEILDDGKPLFRGWAFRDFPDMHSFEDPRYTIKMTRAVAAGG